ncbi:MAG TPA: MFS transporter [Bacillota bacterium]|jgi:MFS family permease
MSQETRPYEPPKDGFRTFLIVWVTQSISVLGSNLTFFATTIWLTQVLYPRPEQKPELAWALSAVSLAFALPTIFGAPLAGAWADRHDRRRTMMAMDLVSGLLSVLLAALLLTGRLNLGVLLALTLVAASAAAFHSSAFDTSYAMLVPDRLLPRANGMMQTMFSLSAILSPAAAAALISLPVLARQGHLTGGLGARLGGMESGIPLPIVIDAVTFFVGAVTLVFLTIPSPVRTDLKKSNGRLDKSIWADVREGALYIWHRRPLLWLLGTFAVANLVDGPLGVLTPLIVKFNLAGDWAGRGFTFETAFALLATISGFGGLVGGLLISAWGGLRKRRVYGVFVPMIFSGLAMVVAGRSSYLYLAAGMFFAVNLTFPICNAHSQTIWQTQTPRELQGRVFAVRRLIAQGSLPLSTAMVGLVTGLLNPGRVVAALGALLAVFCIAQFFNPYLLKVEDKAFLDRMAAGRSVAQAPTPAE